MDIAKINPYIRVAMRSVIHANKEIRRRIIFDYELIHIDDGAFLLNYDGTDYLCQKGDFILLRPNIPHSFSGIHRDLSQPHIHFDITHQQDSPRVSVSFKDYPDLTDREKAMIREDFFKAFPQNPIVRFTNEAYVLQLFYEIIDSTSIHGLQQKAKLILILEQLITDHFQGSIKTGTSHYPIEQSVRDYIDAGQAIFSDLEDIAKQFSYSKYYLDRKFKKAYGISIMAYRNQNRMQTARELLQTHSVSAVCSNLGYSSIFVFSRAYKNYFGYAPSLEKGSHRPL